METGSSFSADNVTTAYCACKQGEQEDTEMEYEVEYIKDARLFKGKSKPRVKYLVKWVGYVEETWEPQEHLTGNIFFEEFRRRTRSMTVTRQGIKWPSVMTQQDVVERCVRAAEEAEKQQRHPSVMEFPDGQDPSEAKASLEGSNFAAGSAQLGSSKIGRDESRRQIDPRMSKIELEADAAKAPERYEQSGARSRTGTGASGAYAESKFRPCCEKQTSGTLQRVNLETGRKACRRKLQARMSSLGGHIEQEGFPAFGCQIGSPSLDNSLDPKPPNRVRTATKPKGTEETLKYTAVFNSMRGQNRYGTDRLDGVDSDELSETRLKRRAIKHEGRRDKNFPSEARLVLRVENFGDFHRTRKDPTVMRNGHGSCIVVLSDDEERCQSHRALVTPKEKIGSCPASAKRTVQATVSAGVEPICISSDSDSAGPSPKHGLQVETKRKPPSTTNRTTTDVPRQTAYSLKRPPNRCTRAIAPEYAENRVFGSSGKRSRRKGAPRRFDDSGLKLTDEDEEEDAPMTCRKTDKRKRDEARWDLPVSDGVQRFRQIVSVSRYVPITVANTVDDDGPPPGFHYTDGYIYTDAVRLRLNGFKWGCSCPGPCTPNGNCVCLEIEDGDDPIPNYRLDGTVNVSPGTKITECSDLCACQPDRCTNRVVQNGRRVRLEIFKTERKGWGVRAVEDIPLGTFVEKYAGEVVSNEEAEVRGRVYDMAGLMYLFDLDGTCKPGRRGISETENDGQPLNLGDSRNGGFVEDSCFAVDASRWGNATHFFNHSCEPNLAVWSVFRHPDAVIHDLAFFTIDDVAAGEELTFEYRVKNEAKKIQCLCGAPTCEGWIR